MYCNPLPTAAQFVGCGTNFTDSQVASLIIVSYGYEPPINLRYITLQNSPAGFKFRLVCLGSSGKREQYSTISLVAYYTITNSSGVTTEPMYGQFEFVCYGLWPSRSNGEWPWSLPPKSPPFGNFSGRLILAPTAPAITAPLRTDCAYCLPINSPTLYFNNYYYTDPINHCYRESSSTTHIRACASKYYVITLMPFFTACKNITGCSQLLCFSTVPLLYPPTPPTCCAVYLSDGITCATQCPGTALPDENNTCGMASQFTAKHYKLPYPPPPSPPPSPPPHPHTPRKMHLNTLAASPVDKNSIDF